MSYTPLDLMGVVVQWSSGLLLLLFFVRLGRFGARRHVVRIWTAAWAAQVLSILGFVIQSVAALLGAPLRVTPAVVALDDLYLPGKLLFAALVAIGTLHAIGRTLRPRVAMTILAAAAVVGVLLVVADTSWLSGAVQLASTVVVFLGGCIVVARSGGPDRHSRANFLATAMFGFGIVTALYQVAFYFPIGSGTVGDAIRMIANTSGYGDALISAVLGAAIVVLLIDDAFRAADSAQRQQLTSLAASESRLTGIVEAAREAIVLVDARGVIELANAMTDHRLALPRRGAMGRSLAEFVRTSGPLMPAIADALAASPDQHPPTATLIAEGVRNDGSTFPLELTVGPVSASQPLGNVVILRDTTAHLAAVAEREQFERRMAESEKMLAIGRVVSGVAHELNNPLAVVLGQSETLIDAPMDDDVRAGLRLINEQAHRARHIVRDLLMFVRQRDEPREPVDATELIKRVVASQQGAARRHNVTLTASLVSGPVEIRADRNGIEQVLLNLVDNAFDAAGAGGRIRVVERVTDDAVAIAVEDSGPGVPQAAVDRIFEPFFTTKPIGHGTGLGLSVSIGIVERHGGTLCLENQPIAGVGARLVMTLACVIPPARPVIPSVAGRRTAIMPQPPSLGAGLTAAVLLIDDEPAVRSTLVRIFQRGGWRVREAASGEEGLGQLLDVPAADLPAVILCDLKMPGMGGREMYHHLATSRPELLPRLIFVTGDVVETSTAAFFASTQAMVVEKPFTVSEIARAVELVLAGAAPTLPI
ncbi:MAG TPA: ATP-binding protein [Gemmatimonadales bacterium]|jgi:two-component system NtrC family sensor kinase